MTARPTLLLLRGRLLDDALRRQRVTADEVRQAIRASGRGDVADVGAVVLESDGTLSVIPADSLGDGSALASVEQGQQGK